MRYRSGMHPAPRDSAYPALSELFHAANRRLRRGWREQLAPLGLSPHQVRALRVIGGRRGPGGNGSGESVQGEGPAAGLRLKDLAEQLHIAPRSATEVVDHLQDLGLVARRPDPTDRRAVRIVLTDAGAEKVERVHADWHRQADDFFAALDDADRAELERLLRLLVEDRAREDR